MATRYKRDPKVITDSIFVDKKSGQLIAKDDITIVFPKSWENSSLSYYDESLSVIGYLGYFAKGRYAVSMVPSLIGFSPNDQTEIRIEDRPYTVLKFFKGSVMVKNINLAVEDKLVYFIYDEIIGLGKTPFYYSYYDLFRLMDFINKYAKTDLGANPAVLELLTANRGRLRKDNSKLIREIIKKPLDINTDILVDFDSSVSNDNYGMVKGQIDYITIPFKNIALGATNFVARSLGAWADPGLTAQLGADKEDKIEELEELLKL